jgi:myo-inositol-1(or 4)-monophosphatase
LGAATGAAPQRVIPAADELLELATAVARAAGELLLRRPEDLEVESKTTATDAVTVMDRAAEQLIVERLSATRPEDRILAEEGGARGGSGELCWLVDPLDGTVNYLYGLRQWSVSIAAELDGAAMVGVVFDPSKDELYAAKRGGGATLNGAVIHVRSQTDLSLALVGTGFAYRSETRAAQGRIVADLLPRVRDLRRLGSAALDLCAVAAGRVDGYFEDGMHRWDWAAGGLIASEAGARVDGLRGQPPGESMVIAANPGLFDALHDALVTAGA